ncbi:helix-turn-helix domain-containing protein [Robertkochia flava]|uniref:helix-turn-helix domain-containing protein n=1 Tax=Robertkochia flava TaxID=3447986 RepID=UPI001CCCFFC5|nr:AraC family transcriptional regulator [Robertkochia marina]
MRLLIAGIIGILVFVGVQIINKDVLNKSSKKFGLLLLLLWLIRFLLIYVKLDVNQTPPAFYIIYDQTLLLLDGPLFWLYTRSLVDPKGFKRTDWLHFVPFLLLFVYSTYLLMYAPNAIMAEYQSAVRNMLDGKAMADIYDSVYILIVLGISLVYIYKAARIARLYNQRLFDHYSSIDNRTATWIITFHRLWVGLFFIPVLIYFILYIYPFFPSFYIAGAVLIALVGFSVFFSFKLLNQTYVPTKSLGRKSKSANPQKTHPDESQVDLLKKLKEGLQKEKYYLDEELTLKKLARHMDIKSAQLTDLIKWSEFDNFYDLVNHYRIEGVKKELIETEEQIIVLAYQNGFKSKSTFNKIFKEKTGLTPKQYRSTHK